MLPIDLTGQTFGRWTVLARAQNTKQGQAKWLCRCSCGTERELKSIVLRRLISQSCGCLKSEVTAARSTKHGHATGGLSPTYTTWVGMLQRCRDPNHRQFKNYGGRGIKACRRWESFENFLADMGERPKDATLDRKNNDGNYTKNNCRWATGKQQGRNKRNNHTLTLNGETHSIAEWAERTGLNYGTIKSRLRYGWEDKRVLTTPPP